MNDEHPNLDRWIDSLLEGTSEPDRTVLDSLRTHCDDCAAEAEGLQAVVDALRRPEPDRAPVRVLGRLIAHQVALHNDRGTAGATRRGWTKVAVAAALAAAVYALGFAQGRDATAPEATAGRDVTGTSAGRKPLPPPPALQLQTAVVAASDLAPPPVARQSARDSF